MYSKNKILKATKFFNNIYNIVLLNDKVLGSLLVIWNLKKPYASLIFQVKSILWQITNIMLNI